MKPFARLMLMTLGFGLLAAVTGLVGPQPKSAQATTTVAAVAVVNTPGVNVANTPTVNSRQAGAWNVGINGTPNVNVANTSANPVQTTDTFRSPGQILELFCSPPSVGGGVLFCSQVDPNSGISSGVPFTVPAGQHFVITSIDVYNTIAGTGFTDVFLGQESPGFSFSRESFRLPNSAESHFEYPSGIVVGPGNQLSFGANSFVLIYLRGYLTPN